MTELRRAAEMALEVLLKYRSDDAIQHYAGIQDSITFLRQALAQPEQKPVAYEVDADVINSQGQSEYRTFLAYRPDPAMTTGGRYEVTKVLEARPLYTALPKQEYQYEVVAEHADGTYTTRRIPKREVWCDCGDGIMPNSGAKCGNCIAAESASREWVGLTDEEIYDYADRFLYQHGSNYGIRSFGKAIEDKLKEKNT